MSTDSDQPGHTHRDRISSPRGLPSFAAFALRKSEESPADLVAAESALLHPRAVAERRETVRLGRLAAHAALQQIGLDTGPVLTGENREPIWPDGASGSISHTTGVGVALVAPSDRTDGVGVDIETPRWAPELEGQVPRPEERSWLDSLPVAERSAWLLALFSAKESIFKAFFPRVGSFFGFEAASLTPTSSGFSGSLVKEIDSSYPATRAIEIGCEWFGTTVITWVILPVSH
jgi:enterobactin synthetase component D